MGGGVLCLWLVWVVIVWVFGLCVVGGGGTSSVAGEVLMDIVQKQDCWFTQITMTSKNAGQKKRKNEILWSLRAE